MATHYLKTVTSIIAAGQYCAIVQHFAVVDPVEVLPYRLAKELVNAFIAPDAGDSPEYKAC